MMDSAGNGHGSKLHCHGPTGTEVPRQRSRSRCRWPTAVSRVSGLVQGGSYHGLMASDLLGRAIDVVRAKDRGSMIDVLPAHLLVDQPMKSAHCTFARGDNALGDALVDSPDMVHQLEEAIDAEHSVVAAVGVQQDFAAQHLKVEDLDFEPLPLANRNFHYVRDISQARQAQRRSRDNRSASGLS